MKPIVSSPMRYFILLMTAAAVWLGSAAQGALVQNPSFESNFNTEWPHLLTPIGLTIDGWIGGTGVDDRSFVPTAYHDNGLTPDRNRVAFQQNAGSLAQDITGLTPGNLYWIQFFYNCRAWQSEGPLDIKVSFDGVQLDQISSVRSVRDPNPFRFRNVPFTPTSSAGQLSFAVTPYGDQTALFDAVTIVARSANDLVIANPSFEASGTLPATGVLTNMAGWSGTGTFGVDTNGGAFADNGNIPDQDLACFIQGQGSIAQTIPRFIVGESYTVSFGCNAKTGETPHLLVKAGDAVIFDADVTAVGAGNAFQTHTASFTAATPKVVISIAQTKAGTDVVLLDNIRVQGQIAPFIPPITLTPTAALIPSGQKQLVAVSVPSEALASQVDLVVGADPNVVAIAGADTNGQVALHIAPAGSAPGSPVSGMKLWLKADAITGLSDGAKVAQWVDVSGFNYHATNPAPANQPTFVANGLNGKPTVRFDDHEQDTVVNGVEFLDSPATVVQTKQKPFTAFVVFCSNETGDGYTTNGLSGRDVLLQPLLAQGRTVLSVDMLSLWSGGAHKFQSVAALASLVSARDYTPGKWTLSTLVQDTNSATLMLFLDRVLDSTTFMGIEPGTHGGWRLGATKNGTGGLKGEVAEVLLYDRTLSVTEREQVEDYLVARWGLVVGTSKTLEVTGVARGSTEVEVVNAGWLDVANTVPISVSTSFVRSPSFESGDAPIGPAGYGTILGWYQTGAGVGRNIAGMPVLGSLANGVIPDRNTVAFIQGAGTISQTIYGLTPGQSYWLQFRYNLRDCCLNMVNGNLPAMDLTVKFGSQTLVTIPAIHSLTISTAGETNYYSTNILFNPATTSGTLQFAATPVTDAGDSSLLLDAVTIVQRAPGEIVVRNPSFEASGLPGRTDYIQPGLISGWTTEIGSWGVNIDGDGTFANNGVAQDQDSVLFLQGTASFASQSVSGLAAGQQHTLIFAMNARQLGTNVTRVRVSFAGEVLLEEAVVPVGAQNPYHAKYLLFIPAFTEGEIKFENISDPSMDSALLIDNVRLVVGDARPPVLEITLLPGANIRVAWPASATGFNLESASTLPGAAWVPVSTAPVLEGNQRVVQLPLGSVPQFFRLKK